MREAKVEAFEYVLYQLNNWYKVAYPKSEDNDISVLKALKLLFFISAVDATKDKEHTLIDDVFTNFVAMPYGHVESDVYSIIKRNLLKKIEINNFRTIVKDYNASEVNPDIKSKIDNSVLKLQSINFDLIKYSSFDLVDISHAWYSWQYFYNRALSLNIQSHPIDGGYIKAEEKIYHL